MSEIKDAFSVYLARSDETTRLSTYEFGRRAMAEGVGLMQWMGMVHQVVIDAIGAARTSSERARISAAAEGFVFECLSPFEMAFQGSREANEALRRQNDLLEQETRRIAHEIHDSAGQLLASVYMELQQLSSNAPRYLKPGLAHTASLLDRIHADLRRFSHELRPTVLDDLGLIPALRELGDGIMKRTGLVVRVEASAVDRLPSPVEVALYRTVQEALVNTTKHAGAGRVDVRVELRAREVCCTVTDDGAGFATQPARGRKRGLGLVGLRERLAPLGGSVRWGTAPGAGGAVVTATIPLETPYVASHPGS
jgi:signal transduction histidine kinase